MALADMPATRFHPPALKEGLHAALRDLAKDVAGAGRWNLSDGKAIGHDALD